MNSAAYEGGDSPQRAPRLAGLAGIDPAGVFRENYVIRQKCFALYEFKSVRPLSQRIHMKQTSELRHGLFPLRIITELAHYLRPCPMFVIGRPDAHGLFLLRIITKALIKSPLN